MPDKMINENDDFDFSSFPKLGRPYKSGAPRTSYVKFYFTADEMRAFDKLQKTVKEFYKKEGYTFNAPDHFRMFVKFYSHPALLRLFFADFELNGIKKNDFSTSDDFIKSIKDRVKK